MKNRKITIIVIILYSSVVDGVFECRRQKFFTILCRDYFLATVKKHIFPSFASQINSVGMQLKECQNVIGIQHAIMWAGDPLPLHLSW